MDVATTEQFRAGLQAFNKGAPRACSPYVHDSEFEERWLAGWDYGVKLAAHIDPPDTRPGGVNCNRALYTRSQSYPIICKRCGTTGLGDECVFYDQNKTGKGPVYTLKSWVTRPPEPEPENYADHPKTLGEARADREVSGSAWSGRDALIHLLRRIDSGDLDPSTVVIAWHNTKDNSKGWSHAGSDSVLTAGLLHMAMHDLLRQQLPE